MDFFLLELRFQDPLTSTPYLDDYTPFLPYIRLYLVSYSLVVLTHEDYKIDFKKKKKKKKKPLNRVGSHKRGRSHKKHNRDLHKRLNLPLQGEVRPP